MDESTRTGRVVRGIIYRLALLPALVLLVTAAITFKRTHPISAGTGLDPSSERIFYEPVTLLADDHTSLDAWLVPALDAHQVLVEGVRALKQHHPAVVLAHGFGMSRQQVLPLIAPLHQDGWIVLALAMRGSESPRQSGQTMGLNESLDVKAAVDFLRARPYVDGKKIAVVGIESGANAAVLAADRDHTLAALVLDGPAQTGQDAVAAHLFSDVPMLRWLNPLTPLAFEVGYGLNVRDLDLDQYSKVLGKPTTLLFRDEANTENVLQPDRITQVVEFLHGSVTAPPVQADSLH